MDFFTLIEEVEPMLYVVIGALTSLLGGFWHNKHQAEINRIEKDKNLLIKADNVLLELYPLKEKNKKIFISPLTKLRNISIQISSRRYSGLAAKIAQFSLCESFRTKKNLDLLTGEIEMTINPKMIQKFEKNIRNAGRATSGGGAPKVGQKINI